MPILVGLFPSPRENKRYRIIIMNPRKVIDFGLPHSNTYVDGASDLTRYNYLKRHAVRENWNELNAGSASAIILWGRSHDVKENLLDFIHKFQLEIPKGTKIIL
jgi:hypothetical protein